MYGWQIIISWFVLFFPIFYVPLRNFDLPMKIIGYWCFFMIFICIFEFLVPFNFDTICEKGNYYYENDKNYWIEDDKKFSDLLTSKMYMNVYSDYSLSDCKYRKGLNDSGFRIVMLGEIIHGILTFIFTCIVLYGMYFGMNKNKLNLHILILGIIQLTLIIWYQSTVIWDMCIESSDNCCNNPKWYWQQQGWNVPWFIFPPYLIYYGYTNLLPLFSN